MIFSVIQLQVVIVENHKRKSVKLIEDYKKIGFEILKFMRWLKRDYIHLRQQKAIHFIYLNIYIA